LDFDIGDWKQWHVKEKSIKNLDRILREFHETMPYTKNSSEQKEERV